MVSTSIIHVITWITTDLPTLEGWKCAAAPTDFSLRQTTIRSPDLPFMVSTSLLWWVMITVILQSMERARTSCWRFNQLSNPLHRCLVECRSMAVKTTNLTISFASQGFPYKDLIEDLFIVMALFVYSLQIPCRPFKTKLKSHLFVTSFP